MPVYLGIDVGKRAHEVALLDADERLLWRLRLAPTRAGFTALGERLAAYTPGDVVVGMEATGAYWLTLHAWLQQWAAERQGALGKLLVLNPLQTRAFRNASLRGSKTDRVDAVAIARLIRWSGQTLAAHVTPDARRAAAREVSRVRTEMIRLRAQELTRLGALYDRLFPELRDVFGDLGAKGARAVLEQWPTPALLATVPVATLVAQLDDAVGRRRADHEEKAARLVTLAATSVGVTDPLDAGAIAVRALLAHVAHLETQIADLATRLDAVLATEASLTTLLRSVPGIGEETARTWLAEAPPVEGLRNDDGKGAERLVAIIGIDAQLRESGQYSGRVRMSKRGNRYLRRSILLAAQTAARLDPQCKALLVRQLQRGKHYNVAVSHVARKLVHILFAVLRRRSAYVLPSEYRLGVAVTAAEAMATA
jgi:transposase